MSDSKSRPPSSGTPRSPYPRAALDALLAGSAGNPLRRAMWLDELDRCLRPLLPPSLATHARLANVDGDRLVFVVDSPVWHARLRLAGDRLLDAARSIGLQVDQVVVKTITPAVPRAPRELAVKPMSAGTQKGLRDALVSLREPRGGTGKDES